MTDDLRELLELLLSHRVDFMVIGGHAFAYYDHARFTEDIDVWVGRDRNNTERLRAALDDFGAPISEEGARRFSEEDRQMIRLGDPPYMVDILNFAGNRPFEVVWANRQPGNFFGLPLAFPSKDDFIDMKVAAGRPQDLLDLENLTRTQPGD